MDAALRTRLLGSIEADRLVVLCGAGLSMAAPSSLPSARVVANMCYEQCCAAVDPDLNPAMRDDLEAIAEHFAATDLLKTVFIDRLVPWSSFVKRPNAGHAAIADFLICRAFAAAISTNYDMLVERWAWDAGADLQSALDGDEANQRGPLHGPLLKIHGCEQRDRGRTVWTKSQLESDPVLAERIEKSSVWLAANLREKDLLVVGFWSDWAYLNGLLERALEGVRPNSIVVVDPSPADFLMAKAPGLWQLANRDGVWFNHVEASGADFLDELRREFSRAYMRKFFRLGAVTLKAIDASADCPVALLEPPELDSDSLYELRRDAEGAPPAKPSKMKAPDQTASQAAYAHVALRRAGAVMTGKWYEIGGRTVRVVNGAGRFINDMRGSFANVAPVIASPDIVVAAGAIDFGLPDSVIQKGRPEDIVRPATAAEWLDLARAKQALNL